MGVDHTASFFYGAHVTKDEFKRALSLDDGTDGWYHEMGLDYTGGDGCCFIEAGSSRYTKNPDDGDMFIAAKSTLIDVKDRRWPMYKEVESMPFCDANDELVVRRFVDKYKIHVDRFGWFATMREW
jgi:hypothetical protein